jgi:hypothetical protein
MPSWYIRGHGGEVLKFCAGLGGPRGQVAFAFVGMVMRGTGGEWCRTLGKASQSHIPFPQLFGEALHGSVRPRPFLGR